MLSKPPRATPRFCLKLFTSGGKTLLIFIQRLSVPTRRNVSARRQSRESLIVLHAMTLKLKGRVFRTIWMI